MSGARSIEGTGEMPASTPAAGASGSLSSTMKPEPFDREPRWPVPMQSRRKPSDTSYGAPGRTSAAV